MAKAKAKTTVEDSILEAVKGAEKAVQAEEAPKAPKQPEPEIIEQARPATKLVTHIAGGGGSGGRPHSVSAQAPAVYNPAQLVAQAIQSGADVEVIEKLGDMAWRWHERAEDARKRSAFDRAMARAQGAFGPIKKNKRVHFKSKDSNKSDTDYMHEDLASVIEGVKPALSANGLFFRFRTTQIPGAGQASAQVVVTCVMTHEEGHYEENMLQAAIDVSGNKNHLQAIASAATYLSRYTLKSACGIAAEEDDDGRKGGDLDPNLPVKTPAPPEQIQEIRDLLLKKGRPESRFLEWADVTRLEDLTEDQVRDAKELFAKVPDKAP